MRDRARWVADQVVLARHRFPVLRLLCRRPCTHLYVLKLSWSTGGHHSDHLLALHSQPAHAQAPHARRSAKQKKRGEGVPLKEGADEVGVVVGSYNHVVARLVGAMGAQYQFK